MQLKKKAVTYNKATVKLTPVDSLPKYEGIATICVMAVYSGGLGMLLAYF